MSDYIIREDKNGEGDLIIERIVEYNLSKIPLRQETPFLWINRVVEDENGEIIAGILSEMYCWNCLYIDVLWVKEVIEKMG